MVVIKSRIKSGLYKQLQLVAPWKAEELLNKSVEGPVFTSSLIQDTFTCGRCGIEYGPLVYKLGERTIAQHLHANVSGGIYTTSAKPPQFRWLAQGTGDDYFSDKETIMCRSFLMETQPRPIQGCHILVETNNGIIIPIYPTYPYPAYGNVLVQVGTVDDGGNMRFPMETWEKWIERGDNERP